MAQRPDVEFALGARDTGVKETVKGIQNSLGEAAERAERFKSALAGVAIGGGLLGAIAQLSGAVRGFIDRADELNKLSQQIGISAEVLSTFQYAAKLADVSTEELAIGLKNLADKATSNDKVFDRIGLDPKKFRDSEQLLLAIAERFSQVGDGAAKTVAATDLFGKAGFRLIPFLNQGAAGFAQIREEAERLGLIMSGATARAAEQFNDSLLRLQTTTGELARSLAIRILPSLQAFVNEAQAGIEAAGGVGAAIRDIGLGPQDPFKTQTENLAALRQELEQIQRMRKQGGDTTAFGESLLGLNDAAQSAQQRQLEVNIRYLERLREIRRQQALAITGGARDLDPRDIRAAPQRPRGLDFKTTEQQKAEEEAGKARQRAAEEYARVIDQIKLRLDGELFSLEKATELDKLRAELARTRGLKPEDRTRLEAQAKELDNIRAAQRIGKETADRAKDDAEVAAARNKVEAEEVNKIAEATERLAKARAEALERTFSATAPGRLEEQRAELLRLQELFEKGRFGDPNSAEAQSAVSKELARAAGLEEATKKTSDAGRQLGLTFQSAFEDAVIAGKKFQDVLGAIGQDIARIILRKSVTEPLLLPLGTAIGGGIDKFIGGLFKAGGGPVSGGSPYIVGEQGPELFIPGSSGSIMPAGNFGGVTIHIDARGADLGAETRLRAAIPSLVSAVKTSLVDDKRRGG